ncbi:MAG: hypothetical protein ABI295_10425 [Xanthomarina sp.]
MTRDEKIIAYLLMTYFISGLSQFLISGNFIAPFLLNNILLVIVSVYFIFRKVNHKKLPLVLFLFGSLCFLVLDKFLLSTFFSDEQIPMILGNPISEWLRITGFAIYSLLLIYIIIHTKRNYSIAKYCWIGMIITTLLFILSWGYPIGIDSSIPIIINGLLILILVVRSSENELNSDLYALYLLFIFMGSLEILLAISFLLAN